jgi:hypothetical protein
MQKIQKNRRLIDKVYSMIYKHKKGSISELTRKWDLKYLIEPFYLEAIPILRE